MSYSVKGNRDERQTVDISLVQQDAQVSLFGVVKLIKM